jgi:UDP-N-acetylmuramate-alanine ligase
MIKITNILEEHADSFFRVKVMENTAIEFIHEVAHAPSTAECNGHRL